MTTSRYVPVDLSETQVGFDRAGAAGPLEKRPGPPPSIDGLTVGAPMMTRSAPHAGEMHPDGDELLYLIAGGVDVVLEDDEVEHVVALQPGQALVVPRGIWHRVVLRQPSHLLYLTPGPRSMRRPLDAGQSPAAGTAAVTDAERTMSAPPRCDQLNLIVGDMDATLDFYRRLGLPVPHTVPDWPAGSGARHAEVAMAEGFRLEFDNVEMARIWHGARRDTGEGRGGSVVGFSLPSRDAVDERYAALTAAGYAGRQPPCDAFWGSRYAIVQDPDGNDIGLMSPPDPARRFVPEV